MSELSFDAPWRLLALLAVVALAIGYLLAQRRRKATAVRFSDVDLLASVAPRIPAWRRHVPAVLLLGALTLMTTAFARPTAEVQVPREAATVVVAIDTSLSMQATDVSPTRFEAAQQAAATFIESLPESFDVALVSFSSIAGIRMAPTDDHEAVVSAVRALQLGEGTAIGEAVAASVASAVQAVGVDGETRQARVVLLSDGTNTQGRAVEDAAQVATSAGVPVSTIAYGTAEGTVTLRGENIPVPVDGPALEALATATGGQFYTAQSSDELSQVYEDISQQVGTIAQRQEVSAGFAGAAMLFTVLAAGMSLLWSPRMP